MLLVGLGNPGKEYEGTRHNVGFDAVDEIIHRYNFSDDRKKFKGLFSEGAIADEKIYILKPQTYMNVSGISVAEIIRFYKIPIEDIIVFHDELDIPVGKIKAKKGGGNGGHNGIKSLDEHVSKGYNRIRIGIDHPGDKNKVSSYVLKQFSYDDGVKIDKVIGAVAESIPIFITEGREKFLTKYALLTNEPKIVKNKIFIDDNEESLSILEQAITDAMKGDKE